MFDLRPHLLRVRTNNGKVAGTAFLARAEDGRAYVLTCAHVVNIALGRASAAQPSPGPAEAATGISVERVGSAAQQATLLHWIAPVPVGPARSSALADIAVLSSPFSPDPAWPSLRIEPPGMVVPEGSSVAVHGFGYMGPDDGTAVQGILRAVDHSGWFIARQPDGSGWFIEPGLSGAPLLGSDGRVLGMVAQKLEAGSGEGMAIPTMALAQAWPPLACPYVGLRRFEPDTAHLFFGRAATIAALRNRLNRQAVVGVVGASGSGKSSLVRAGLMPALSRERWATVMFEPKQFPLSQLAEAVARAVTPRLATADLPTAAEGWRTRLAEGRLDAVLEALAANGAAGVVVVMDQFEQFATADDDRAAAVGQECNLILRALRDTVATRDNVRVVLTLRADLVGRVLDAGEEAGRLLRDPYPPFILPRMDGDELRQAIRDGAALFGVDVERSLATRLADDAGRDEGRLPLLQSALRGLWRGLERQADGRWRLPSPAEGLDLEGMLARRADEALAALRAGRGGPPLSDDALRRALTSLVRLSGADEAATKRVVAGPNLGTADTSEWMVLQRLAGERLVVLGATGRVATAELAHEALITRWPTLAQWVADDRDFLRWRDRLREFELPRWLENSRDDGSLLAGRDLAVAEGWLRDRSNELTADEVNFIEASAGRRRRQEDEGQARLRHEQELRAAAVRARRRAVRALWAMGASVAAFLVAVLVIRQTELSMARERTQAFIAERQKELAQQAESLVQTNPLRAYLIAVQAANWRGFTSDNEFTLVPWQVSQTLRRTGEALLARPVEGVPPGLPVRFVSRSSTRFMTSRSTAVADGVQVWTLDPSTGRATGVPLDEAETEGVERAMLSSDGSRILLTRRRGEQIQVRAGTTSDLGMWLSLPDGATPLMLDPDLRKMILSSRGRVMATLNMADGQIQHLPQVPASDRPMYISRDAAWLITERGDLNNRQIALWPLGGKLSHLEVSEAKERYLDIMETEPGVVQLLTTPSEGGLRLWTLSATDRRNVLLLPSSRPVFARFTPDGRKAFVFTSEAGGTQASLVGLDGSGEVAFGQLGSSVPLAGSFDAKGERVVLLTGDTFPIAAGPIAAASSAAGEPAAAGFPTGRPAYISTTWLPHPGGATMAAVLEDGKHALTLGQRDGRLLLWNLDQLLEPDQERFFQAVEREAAARIASGAGACLTSQDFSFMNLIVPNSRSPEPDQPGKAPGRQHACPLAKDFVPP